MLRDTKVKLIYSQLNLGRSNLLQSSLNDMVNILFSCLNMNLDHMLNRMSQKCWKYTFTCRLSFLKNQIYNLNIYSMLCRYRNNQVRWNMLHSFQYLCYHKNRMDILQHIAMMLCLENNSQSRPCILKAKYTNCSQEDILHNKILI